MPFRPRLQNYPSQQFRNADEMSEVMTRLFAPVKVEAPEGGTLANCRLHIAPLGEFSALYGAHDSPIDIARAGDSDAFHFHVPQIGRAEITTGGQVLSATPQQGVLTDHAHASRFRITHSAAFETIVLSLPRRELTAELSARLDRTLHEQIRFSPIIDLGSPAGATLASLADTLVTGIETNLLSQAPIAVTNLTQALLSLFIETVPHQFSHVLAVPAPAAAPRHVKRAIDFMRANLGEPLTIAEIAEASQASVRTLQSAFREFRETTPLAYLRHLRLEASQRQLADPANTSSIAEVALKWGFGHLGRFSSEYREAFGELPSETLARTRP